MTTPPTNPPKTWRKGEYFISTDPSLIPLQTLNEWFASDELYWASPLPLDLLRLSIQSCLCFGLFYAPGGENTIENTAAEFVGIARGVTDYVTFVYITDVYVHSSHQGKGLGRWLVECVGEVVDAMPYLRRSMLFTMDWQRSVPFYEKILSMSAQEVKKGEGMAMMMKKGNAYPAALHD